jgi:uncharacterized protein (DUF2141 family)
MAIQGIRFLLLVVLLISPAWLAQSQQAAGGNMIHVEISGFHSDKGEAFCALFAPGKAFPSDAKAAVVRIKAPISHGKATCEFTDVAPGRYAVSVFHDENSNQKLDTNFLGIPKEGVGASNDAKGRMGPPKFDAAAFQYSGGRLELKITIFYI